MKKGWKTMMPPTQKWSAVLTLVFKKARLLLVMVQFDTHRSRVMLPRGDLQSHSLGKWHISFLDL